MKPVQKVGSLFTRPNWRYDALINPARYSLQEFAFIPSSGAGCLKRYLELGIEFEVNYTYPHYLDFFLNNFSDELKNKLLSVYQKQFKKSGRKKITCQTDQALFRRVPIWNTKKIDKLPDVFLRRAMYHLSQLKFDKAIHEALLLHKDENNKEQLRFIGYSFYAGVSAIDLAKRWRISVNTIEALRLLFYDFSNFPKDRVANLSYLRQLTNIGAFDDEDFAYYKRVFDLGELGIRAQTDYYGLSESEKQKVAHYLSQSIVSNTLNLNFAIRSQKDAYNYSAHVGQLANYYVKQKEIEYFQAKVENLKISTKRLEQDTTSNALDTTDTDQMYIDLLREYSLQESTDLPYKSVQDLE